ncbi:S1 family peptidase [Lysobacter rhizosphaerae]
MRKFASWAKRGLIVLSPLPLAFAMSASAAGPSDSVSPSLRAAMQRDLGLTSAQLSQYLKIERLAAQQEKQLAKAQGRNFAGSWIEQANGSFKLVVATTTIRPQQAGADVEVRNARHSLADLDASKAQLDAVQARGGKVPKGVYGWYVDLPGNSVVVSVGKGAQQAGIDFVAASGVDVQNVRLVTEDEQPSLRSTLQGGLGYLRNPGDGYLYACSIGFTVTQGSMPGYVSAGHCGTANEPVYLELSPQWTVGPRIGTFAASKFPQPGQTGNDYSWVRVDAGNTLLPAVYGWGKGDVTVRGGTEAAVGAAICRSGRTSGWRCGTIEAKNQTVNYSSGETILNLTRTTACSEGGDSGGSFITGPGQAQGVLSGGSGSCKGKQPNSRTRSFYQPLLPILSAYNLTLRTSP